VSGLRTSEYECGNKQCILKTNVSLIYKKCIFFHTGCKLAKHLHVETIKYIINRYLYITNFKALLDVQSFTNQYIISHKLWTPMNNHKSDVKRRQRKLPNAAGHVKYNRPWWIHSNKIKCLSLSFIYYH
jgi:hypothetical protein